RAPGNGRRNPHRRVRGGRHRGARLVLGRDRGRRPGRGRAGRHHLLQPLLGRSFDVPADGAGAAAAATRAPRRAHPEVRVTAMRKDHAPLIVAALVLVLLPFALDVAGLPLRSAIDVVVFAIACMGLNVLVGQTGLVSFGHGAWFGLGAYAAALSQRYWFPGDLILPA